jgi:membrane protein implicated in regulation of membrane protease activity
MSINLNDFLGQHLVLLWLFIAVMLGALELLRRNWTMAVLAVAALVAALTAIIVAHAWYTQLAIFVIVTIVGEVVVRRRQRVPGTTEDTPMDSV